MKTRKLPKFLGTAASLTVITAGTLRAQQPPDERFSIMLGGSMTAAGDVEYKGDDLGEVETSRFEIEGSYSIPLNEHWRFEVGGTYNHLKTDHDHRDSLIPGNLSAISLDLRAMWRINDKWRVSAGIAPGFYGDDEVDFSDALNVPLMALAFWQKSEDLSVAFGFRVDAFSDMPFIPVLGVNWKINPEWELSLGLPKTELRYEWSRQLSLYGGMAFEGNSYAVDDASLETPSGRPLRDTYVSESEFRALLGFEYKFDSGVKLAVEGGYAFGREFDYHEKDVKLEIDPGAFSGVSVSFAF